jgi:surface antigen
MARLWRPIAAFALALAVGLPAAGCSTSYQLGSLTGKDEAKTAQASAAGPETTGSILLDLPPESDLVLARAAAAEVLGRGGKDSSSAWENPKTGARGTVTPISNAYSQDGRLCRDFLASHVRDGSEAWMQGDACRMGQAGKWEVRNLKPWRKS